VCGIRTTALGLRPQDFGELAVSALAASAALILLAIAYVAWSALFRGVTHRVVLLIALLVFFGVAVDTTHVALTDSSAMNRALAVIEDDGEMIVVSVLCWYALRLVVLAPPRPCFARDRVCPPTRRSRAGLLVVQFTRWAIMRDA